VTKMTENAKTSFSALPPKSLRNLKMGRSTRDCKASGDASLDKGHPLLNSSMITWEVQTRTVREGGSIYFSLSFFIGK
jgi:hypothetical protein